MVTFMSSARILLIEDERIIALDIQMRLERLGYDVIGVAASGEQAIQLTAESNPDLIIMDIQLAGEIDGVAAAKIICERDPVPIVFLTAYTDEDTLRRALTSEPDGYLLKPFSNQDLRDIVKLVLERRQTD